jgi:hypothetical protein
VAQIGFVRGDRHGPNRLRSGRPARAKSASFGETGAGQIGFVRGDRRGPNRLRSGRTAARGFARRGCSRSSATKLPKSEVRRAESSRHAAWEFSEDVSLPTDLSHPRAIPLKTPQARDRSRRDASSPHASLCQQTCHVREQRGGHGRHGEAPVFASGASAPTASLCQWTRHVREKRLEGCIERWVSRAFPTVSIQNYREKSGPWT